MNSKITLINPPDIFENGNKSLLFVNLSDQDQDQISKWLMEKNLKEDLNIYVYSGEPNISWYLYAASRCENKYMNLDNANEIILLLSSYFLSKSGFYYKITDENMAAVYSHINIGRVKTVVDFLERVFSDEKYQS